MNMEMEPQVTTRKAGDDLESPVESRNTRGVVKKRKKMLASVVFVVISSVAFLIFDINLMPLLEKLSEVSVEEDTSTENLVIVTKTLDTGRTSDRLRMGGVKVKTYLKDLEDSSELLESSGDYLDTVEHIRVSQPLDRSDELRRKQSTVKRSNNIFIKSITSTGRPGEHSIKVTFTKVRLNAGFFEETTTHDDGSDISAEEHTTKDLTSSSA